MQIKCSLVSFFLIPFESLSWILNLKHLVVRTTLLSNFPLVYRYTNSPPYQCEQRQGIRMTWTPAWTWGRRSGIGHWRSSSSSPRSDSKWNSTSHSLSPLPQTYKTSATMKVYLKHRFPKIVVSSSFLPVLLPYIAYQEKVKKILL